MHVYVRSAGGRRNGKFLCEDPFKYVAAAQSLSTLPKLRGDVQRSDASDTDVVEDN